MAARATGDLVDIDAMLADFGCKPDFWEMLVERADQLNLGRPLFYGLRYCQRLLGTGTPGLTDRCVEKPSSAAAAVMDSLFLAAFATAM